MRKFTMRESKFGAPVGIYQARFEGVEDRTSEQYGPGLEWSFTITEGKQAGQVVSRTTAPAPTDKNSCGKMLRSLAGRAIATDEELDIEPFVGKIYQVVIEENATGKGTRVGQVMSLSGAPGAKAASAPPPPGPMQRPAPPAPKSSAGIKEPDPVWYWSMETDGQGEQRVVEVTDRDIRALLTTGRVKPEDLPVMAHDKAGGWRTAKDFDLHLPF